MSSNNINNKPNNAVETLITARNVMDEQLIKDYVNKATEGNTEDAETIGWLITTTDRQAAADFVRDAWNMDE